MILRITLILTIFLTEINMQAQNCLNFDGTDYVHISTTPLTGNNNFTIEFHARTFVPGGGTMTRAFGFQGFELDVAINGYNLFIHDNGWHNTGFTLTNSVWYHIAITFDSGSLTVYVDGLSVFSLSGRAFNFTGDYLRIGAKSYTPTSSTTWNGEIDEFRIWSEALTQSEIQNIDDCELLGNEACLVSYYNFNQGTAGGDNTGETSLTDLHTNGNDGVLTNFNLVGSTSNWVSSSASVSGTCTNVACSNLPVELTEFTCVAKDGLTQLNWTTASEINNFGFEIERSTDGRNWRYIDFVQGNGTSNEVNQYQLIDFRPLSGINYYRLKQTDFDGAFEYSNVINAIVHNDNMVEISPNPASSEILLNGNYLGKRYLIVDVMGKRVKEGELSETNEINISDLEEGNYFIKLIDVNEVVQFTKL